jgi:excisionase family DNA binding protein
MSTSEPIDGPDPGLRLYSLQTAANVLGEISERQVYNLIYDGHLRKVKLGKRTCVRADDVDAYIESNTEPPAA